MLSQTPEQKAELNIKIADIMENLIPSHIESQIAIHGSSIERKLGLTEDDLTSIIREQVWKALLTHTPTGGANIKTWVKKLIDNKFKSLIYQSTIKKYNLIEYGADDALYSSDSDVLTDENTSERLYELYERRMAYKSKVKGLSEIDKAIYIDLIDGYGIAELMKRKGLNRTEIIQSIKRIDLIIKTSV